MNRIPDEGGTIMPDGRPWSEQPRWRRDFPIGVEADEYVSRRDFTSFMVLISSAFACGQLWIVAQNAWRARRGKPPVMEIARLSELPVGAAITFRYPTASETCVLVRLEDQKLVAFNQACTHLSCPVIPRVAENRFECPCHHGSFDLESGRPTAGPPRRPLTRIRIEIAGDRVLANGYA
jgi:nitrite reductase/ring-hydroxylating ferredoxin subunit